MYSLISFDSAMKIKMEKKYYLKVYLEKYKYKLKKEKKPVFIYVELELDYGSDSDYLVRIL